MCSSSGIFGRKMKLTAFKKYINSPHDLGNPSLPRSNVTALSQVNRLKLLALGKDLVLLP